MTGLSFSQPVPGATAVVLSLGMGLDSTALAFAAAQGLIAGRMPDVAFYSDTQAESAEIQEHVRWMQSGNALPFPVEVVTGGDLQERVDEAAAGRLRNVVPFFTESASGRHHGQLIRGCTRDYKIRPVERAIRRHLGLTPRQRIPPGVIVEQWLGINAGEVFRASPSGHAHIVNRWPLIELGWRRDDCEAFLRRNELPVPPKSRCVFCPYTSDARWAAIKAKGGDDWRKAVETDRAIREGFPGSSRRAYIHESLRPLDEVEFTNSTADLLEHECKGYCGT